MACYEVLDSVLIGLVAEGIIIRIDKTLAELKNKGVYYLRLVSEPLVPLTADYTVNIDTADIEVIPIFTANGNYLRGDQIEKGMVLRLFFGNDPLHFTSLNFLKCSSYVPETMNPIIDDGNPDDSNPDDSESGGDTPGDGV